MATKKPAAAGPQADAPARDQRDEIIARLEHQLVAMEGRFAALESAHGAEFLPLEEMPVFEIGPGGYYSADDVLYPEGVIIEDVTGRMPLNEQLVPINEPAQARMQRYLQSLPAHGGASHEFVIEAMLQMLPELNGVPLTPDVKTEFHARVLEQAGRLRMTQLGLMPGQANARAASPQPAAARAAIPLMPNTRIRTDAGPTGILPPADRLARGAVKTRARAAAVAPANKAAPPMSGVASTNLGTAGPGARAA
jgi:hypothetical protein